MISFNDAMEKALDENIDKNAWYMKFPIIVEYEHFDWESKMKRGKRYCEEIV